LSGLQLETEVKNVLTHNNELDMASYKIKEVEKLIANETFCKYVTVVSASSYWLRGFRVTNKYIMLLLLLQILQKMLVKFREMVHGWK
jgi:hypothetical protein